jgi:dipeptidase E
MNRLLLTSAGLANATITKHFLKLVKKPAAELKIIFVPTASTRTEEELKYVRASKDELIELGVSEPNIEVLDLDHRISYEELEGFDVVYVCGGNTFYLLHKVRESGFDIAVKRFVQDGKVYFGVSAGSILVGPEISIAGISAEGMGDENDMGVRDMTGLKLIDVIVCPHFSSKDKAVIDEFRKRSKSSVVTLTDDQALLVIGNEKKVIGQATST